MARGAVAVTIAGQEYRIRSESDAEESWLQEVAGRVDEMMLRIRDRTGTVDTRDLAVLTALNLARELMSESRQRSLSVDANRIGALIHLVESALGDVAPADA